jgi:rhodanese-related sulfurtransferase
MSPRRRRRPRPRSRARLAAALTAGLLVLAACGGDDAGTSAEAAAATAPSPAAEALAPEAARALLDERGDELTVIDVRTPEEYAAGHLEGAVNIDAEDPSFADRIAELPADGAYVVYCRSGRRSALAAAAMREAGFTEVYDIGGLLVLQAEGFPVVTD